jgi:hypothetical protein
MPEVNMTYDEFNQFLATNQTAATSTLNVLFAAPATLTQHPEYENLRAPGALNNFSPGLRALLGEEADNMAKWPGDQMERMRQALVTAIRENRPVHFFSKLYNGTGEEMDIQNPDPQGHITITLRSPWKNVRVSVLVGA